MFKLNFNNFTHKHKKKCWTDSCHLNFSLCGGYDLWAAAAGRTHEQSECTWSDRSELVATYRITDVWTDIIKLGTVFHAHGAPGGSETRHSLDVAPIDVRSRNPTDRHMVTVHTVCTRTYARFTWLHWTAWGWCDWSGRTLSPARSRRRCSRRTWKTESNNSRSTSASHCVRELTYEGLFLLDSEWKFTLHSAARCNLTA